MNGVKACEIINNISVIILTKNEEKNIEKCLKSVVPFFSNVFVLDSYSSDRTVEISKFFGAKVFFNKFISFGDQRKYAITKLPIETEWILFLDADETICINYINELREVTQSENYDAYECRYRFIFLGRWIKFGGYYGTKITRLFRKDKASVSRDMNEHITVSGKVGFLKEDIHHNDLKGLDDWLVKHIKYASYEALELEKNDDSHSKFFGSQTQRKRWVRYNIWNKLLPPLVRPFLYFLYRFVVRFGFLDGIRGFVFHFLHGFWYPFLIDVKYLSKKYNW